MTGSWFKIVQSKREVPGNVLIGDSEKSKMNPAPGMTGFRADKDIIRTQTISLRYAAHLIRTSLPPTTCDSLYYERWDCISKNQYIYPFACDCVMSSHCGWSIFSHHIDFGLGHMTSFGQWDDSGYKQRI